MCIIGFSDLLQQRLENPEHLSFVEKIILSSNNLLHLINDILDLSKIEAGKMEIRSEDVLLEELLDEVSHSVSALVMNKSAVFELERETNTRIVINTDRDRVVQVLINLLGNAVKFTDEGMVKLKVSRQDDRLKI